MRAPVDARPDGHEAIATERGKRAVEGRTLKHHVGGQICQGHAAAISLECTKDGELRRGDTGPRELGVIQPCQRPGRPPHDARGTGGLVDGVWMSFHYVAYSTYDIWVMNVNSRVVGLQPAHLVLGFVGIRRFADHDHVVVNFQHPAEAEASEPLIVYEQHLHSREIDTDRLGGLPSDDHRVDVSALDDIVYCTAYYMAWR